MDYDSPEVASMMTTTKEDSNKVDYEYDVSPNCVAERKIRERRPRRHSVGGTEAEEETVVHKKEAVSSSHRQRMPRRQSIGTTTTEQEHRPRSRRYSNRFYQATQDNSNDDDDDDDDAPSPPADETYSSPRSGGSRSPSTLVRKSIASPRLASPRLSVRAARRRGSVGTATSSSTDEQRVVPRRRNSKDQINSEDSNLDQYLNNNEEDNRRPRRSNRSTDGASLTSRSTKSSGNADRTTSSRTSSSSQTLYDRPRRRSSITNNVLSPTATPSSNRRSLRSNSPRSSRSPRSLSPRKQASERLRSRSPRGGAAARASARRLKEKEPASSSSLASTRRLRSRSPRSSRRGSIGRADPLSSKSEHGSSHNKQRNLSIIGGEVYSGYSSSRQAAAVNQDPDDSDLEDCGEEEDNDNTSTDALARQLMELRGKMDARDKQDEELRQEIGALKQELAGNNTKKMKSPLQNLTKAFKMVGFGSSKPKHHDALDGTGKTLENSTEMPSFPGVASPETPRRRVGRRGSVGW